MLTISGCASPEVVQVRQMDDSSLTCDQLKDSYDEAYEFEGKARKERGVTGTNVAAAVFFWPALLATYSNTDDAVTAAKDRQNALLRLAEKKNCEF